MMLGGLLSPEEHAIVAREQRRKRDVEQQIKEAVSPLIERIDKLEAQICKLSAEYKAHVHNQSTVWKHGGKPLQWADIFMTDPDGENHPQRNSKERDKD